MKIMLGKCIHSETERDKMMKMIWRYVGSKVGLAVLGHYLIQAIYPAIFTPYCHHVYSNEGFILTHINIHIIGMTCTIIILSTFFMFYLRLCMYIYIQVAALAPLALQLVLEARCASIILCCGVVHHCSYTAHVQTCE